ncbi:uncharacterized protein LOC112551252 [Alligator sinensis]|uniref:Uncharacterized protein LOC112551252 n=1 Tax=Alligator sinensis TaxID=38654 RepID=A0A3Q0H4J5_ALLSI|nr:uncharacterized protein LOC112551252 [Alligator sinensis]
MAEHLTSSPGTLLGPWVSLPTSLDPFRPHQAFQGTLKTWTGFILRHQYYWSSWAHSDAEGSPDPAAVDTPARPVLYGITTPAWMAADGTTQGNGRYGYYCKPCYDVHVISSNLGPNSAQQNELLAFYSILEHCLECHNGPLPVLVIAIDSEYIYRIATGAADPSKNSLLWEDVFQILRHYVVLPMLKHTRSHRPDTDPIHAIIDKLLAANSQNEFIEA